MILDKVNHSAITTEVRTMSSSQFAKLLGYDKGEVNRKIKAMFADEIQDGKIPSTLRANHQVDEYHLPEVESNMFVARWDVSHLRTVSEYFVNGKAPVKQTNPYQDTLDMAEQTGDMMLANYARGKLLEQVAIKQDAEIKQVQTEQVTIKEDVKALTKKVDGQLVADVVPNNMANTNSLLTMSDYRLSYEKAKQLFVDNLACSKYVVATNHGLKLSYHFNIAEALDLLMQVGTGSDHVTQFRWEHPLIKGRFELFFN